MQKFDSLNDVIHAIIQEIEDQGANVLITGGSLQSCSTYFEVNGLAVRVSDHAPGMQFSEVNYHIGLNSSHGDDMLDAHPYYERYVVEFDENDEEISSEYIECEEDDDDAELVGYSVSLEEIKRVAANAIDAANEQEEDE